MAIIVPAILEKIKEGFEAKARSFERISGVERIQVDFCDGLFVPSVTVGVKELDVLNPAFTWEAHLMLHEPTDFFEYQIAGFTTIIIHFEAFTDKVQLAREIGNIRSLGLKVGLAINPETELSELTHYGELVDQFTMLGVHPGSQGQDIIPEIFGRIKSLRQLLPHAIIEVDGGVRAENIQQITEAGGNVVVVGSALAGDPEWDFEKLREAIDL